VTRRLAYLTIAAASAAPRLGVLLHEGGAILAANVEKSDIFAQTFVHDGTFGLIPGEPSAYTQPLYGWFLIPVYWIFGRSWLSIGLAQIVVAVVVAWLVYEIARRFAGRRWAVVAAVVSTWHPYLVWHDVHVNREIIDQLCAAALVLLTLLVAERPTAIRAVLLGIVTGLAMLGNTRLVFVPVVCVVYLAFRLPRTRTTALACALVLAGAGVTVLPWLVRNRVNVGCWAMTTDGRAFWKANNPQTYHLLATHQWIDNVSPGSPRPPHPGYLTPEEAQVLYVQKHVKLRPDECLEMRFYQRLAETYLENHPRAKLKLAGLSEQLFWQPNVIETTGSSSSSGFAKHVAEPAYMIVVYAAAALGLLLAPRAFVWLALALFAYESFWAALFVGATRYRIAFDFLLVLLGTFALARLQERRA
jgi:4-amino-4-deoxy-L-arabinose transferase-like glycosyltransferase